MIAKIKYMFLGVIFFLFFVWINIIIWGGEYFDKRCVRGKLNANHIEVINQIGWKKSPIETKDRIVAKECSEFLRKTHFRDINWWKPYRTWIQVHILGGKI